MTGITGKKARFSMVLPKHTLSFKSKVRQARRLAASPRLVCVRVSAAGLSSLLVRITELTLCGRFACCGLKVFICNIPLSGSLKQGIVAFRCMSEYCRIS